MFSVHVTAVHRDSLGSGPSTFAPVAVLSVCFGVLDFDSAYEEKVCLIFLAGCRCEAGFAGSVLPVSELLRVPTVAD